MDSPVETHRDQAPKRLRFAVVTVSSSRSLESDDSGRLAAEAIEKAGHQLLERRVVVDDIAAIRAAVSPLLDQLDVLILNGGTGFSPSDVTPEALTPLFERSVEGFGELFRHLSFAEIGSAAMLSRACAGVIDRTAIFLLPGSPKAVRLALNKLILPEIGHLIGQMQRSR